MSRAARRPLRAAGPNCHDCWSTDGSIVGGLVAGARALGFWGLQGGGRGSRLAVAIAGVMLGGGVLTPVAPTGVAAATRSTSWTDRAGGARVGCGAREHGVP